MLEVSSFIEPVGRLLIDCDLNNGSVYTQLGDMGVVFQEAQQRIVGIVRKLEEQGELVIQRGSDDVLV